VDPSIIEINQVKSKLSKEQFEEIKMVLMMNKLTKNLENYEIDKLVDLIKL
jgi:predicted nucleic acid-binding protein